MKKRLVVFFDGTDNDNHLGKNSGSKTNITGPMYMLADKDGIQ